MITLNYFVTHRIMLGRENSELLSLREYILGILAQITAFFAAFLPCNDHFCVMATFCHVTTTFCHLLPLSWCANAVDFTNGFLPGLHNLHWLCLGISYMGTADPSSIVIPI